MGSIFILSFHNGDLFFFITSFRLQNLICSKNLVIDKSIQTAYIQAIRSAQHFIYIENQYFLGSSYAWPSYKDAGEEIYFLIIFPLIRSLVSTYCLVEFAKWTFYA